MMHLDQLFGRTTSRRALLGLGPAALGLAFAGAATTRASLANQAVDEAARGDMPTTGGMRPGPVGLNPPQMRRPGVAPIAMKIQKAQVDAQVEPQPIQDGVMLDPTGPFVIAWYEDTGKLGEETNIVFAGHLDYYDVGPAVFYDLYQLVEGDPIEIIGEGEEVFTYLVEWGRNFTVDELDADSIQSIVGKTDTESATLITCGGTFDYTVGQYLERYVVRAKRAQ
jgi:LPXTG-site transpeptidase (sortase) family protein